MISHKFFIFSTLLALSCISFFVLWEYTSLRPTPLSVQVLRKADKSTTLKPFVREYRELLIEFFGKQRTKKVLSTTKHLTKEVAVTTEYSLVFAISMLGALFVALNIFIYKSRWSLYKTQEDDTPESILWRFTMVESALLRHNPSLHHFRDTSSGKLVIPAGYTLTVRNRHFIEKEYLDQLKYVLHLHTSHFSE